MDVDGEIEFPGKDPHTEDVIVMFMGYEDTVEMGGIHPPLDKSFRDLLAAETAVDKEFRVFRFNTDGIP